MTTYLSLFAGAGGWDLGCDAAGWDCVGQVENDKWCNHVLDRHWPDVPKWWDVTDVNGRWLEPADVITFGSPCTDLSIAGGRAGIRGEGSGLFFEATRIIKEMRDASAATLPHVAVWENVRGALSSQEGDDFGVVLDTLGQLGAVAVEWRVVDGLAFGPPHRRTRVFVVAQFDPGARGGPEVFADPDGVPWDPPSLREAWEDTATTSAGGTPDGGLDRVTVGAIGTQPDRRGAQEVDAGMYLPMYANTLTARDTKGPPSRVDAGQYNIIPTVAYSITPMTGQGSDLQAVEVDAANSLIANDRKVTDRGNPDRVHDRGATPDASGV